MRRTFLSLAFSLACLGAVAQGPKVPQASASQSTVESYFLTLRRSTTYPSMVVLEIYAPDTRALHVDQFQAAGEKVIGSLDVGGSDQPADGRLARYEYRGDTRGDQVHMDVKLPNGAHLLINKSVGSSMEYLRLQTQPRQQALGQSPSLVFHPIDTDLSTGSGGGCSSGKVSTTVSTVACGRSSNLTLCCTPLVVLTWDDSCNVSCQ